MRNINILVHFCYYWSAFSISFAIDTKSILCILQEFNQNQNNHPVITTKNLGHENVKMFKSASGNDQYVLMKSENSKSYTNRSSGYQNVVIFVKKSSKITRLQNQLQHLKFALLIFEEENNFGLFYDSLKIKIHQEIYFLKITTLYEMYQVNNILIQRKLGKWNQSSNKFEWNHTVNPHFTKRRGNFYGIHLMAMTETEGKSIEFDSNYQTRAPFFRENDTYYVNDYTQGIYHDVLKIMQNRLNFTTSLYKRKTEAWGYVNKAENGSYIGDGIGKKFALKK